MQKLLTLTIQHHNLDSVVISNKPESKVLKHSLNHVSMTYLDSKLKFRLHLPTMLHHWHSGFV